MVLPSSMRPPDEGWIPRELAALRRSQREGIASVAASFNTTMSALSAAQDQLAAQVAFLLGQNAYAEYWNIPTTEGIGRVTIDPVSSSTGVVWLAYDAIHDTTLDVTTSSTGSLSISISGMLELWSRGFVNVRGFFGLEILQGVTVIDSPDPGDGPNFAVVGDSAQIRSSTTAPPYLTDNYSPLTPHTTYTLRTRRGYQMIPSGGSSPLGRVQWTGAAIAATKLGM